MFQTEVVLVVVVGGGDGLLVWNAQPCGSPFWFTACKISVIFQIAKDMERWAKSVNAAKTQLEDTKKSAAAASKPEESKPVETEVFKVVR